MIKIFGIVVIIGVVALLFVKVKNKAFIRGLVKAAMLDNSDAQCELGKRYLDGDGVNKNPEEAVKWFRKAIEHENAEALFSLGMCYLTGEGVSLDAKMAAKLLLKAAEQDNWRAQYRVSWLFAEGQGVEKNEQEFVKWLHKAARNGYWRAQYELGLFYLEGSHVEKDAQKAVKWFRKAAMRDDQDSQYYLGWCYANGRGVELDPDEAVLWWRKAAEKGQRDAIRHLKKYTCGDKICIEMQDAAKLYAIAKDGNGAAEYKLSEIFSHGRGVDYDAEEADKWLFLAVKHGDADAQASVAWRYWGGYNVPMDRKEAIKLWRRAAESGHQESLYRLDSLLEEEVEVDKCEVAHWWLKAAKLGILLAQYNIGSCYARGYGVKVDDVEAVKWYQKAAGQGYARAQFSLGGRYLYGLGVNTNLRKALMWYRKSYALGNISAESQVRECISLINHVDRCKNLARHGNVDAQFELGRLYENGEGLDADRNLAIKWYGKAADNGLENAKAALMRLGRLCDND